MSFLVLIRHGISQYNAKGLWTGWDNPDLTPEGEKEAEVAGQMITDIHFDFAYASPLLRHKKTLEIVLKTIHQDLPIITAEAIKERNYGDFKIGRASCRERV